MNNEACTGCNKPLNPDTPKFSVENMGCGGASDSFCTKCALKRTPHIGGGLSMMEETHWILDPPHPEDNVDLLTYTQNALEEVLEELEGRSIQDEVTRTPNLTQRLGRTLRQSTRTPS